MYRTYSSAEAAVVEVLRPRSSGQAQDTHVVRQSKEPVPDYERMRKAVQGEADSGKDTSKDGK
jgi:hypothetical protein